MGGDDAAEVLLQTNVCSQQNLRTQNLLCIRKKKKSNFEPRECAGVRGNGRVVQKARLRVSGSQLYFLSVDY